MRVRTETLALEFSVPALIGPTRAWVAVGIFTRRSIREVRVHGTRLARSIARLCGVARADGGAAHRTRRRDGARRFVATTIDGRTRRTRLELASVRITAVIVALAVVIWTVALLTRLDDPVATHGCARRRRRQQALVIRISNLRVVLSDGARAPVDFKFVRGMRSHDIPEL